MRCGSRVRGIMPSQKPRRTRPMRIVTCSSRGRDSRRRLRAVRCVRTGLRRRSRKQEQLQLTDADERENGADCGGILRTKNESCCCIRENHSCYPRSSASVSCCFFFFSNQSGCYLPLALRSFQFMMVLNPMMNVPCVCQRQNGRMVNITTCPLPSGESMTLGRLERFSPP